MWSIKTAEADGALASLDRWTLSLLVLAIVIEAFLLILSLTRSVIRPFQSHSASG